MTNLTTHYDNLKVARNATPAVIKAAYRVLAQEFHPDRCTRPDAARITQIINDAYAVLSDPVKREKHDRWIEANAPKGAAPLMDKQKLERLVKDAMNRREETMRTLHRADLYAIRQIHDAEVKILKGSLKFERWKGIVIGMLVSLPIYFIYAGASTVIDRVHAKQREHIQQQFNQKKESTMLRN